MIHPLSFEVLQAPTTKTKKTLPIYVANTWTTPIYKFLTEEESPINESQIGNKKIFKICID